MGKKGNTGLRKAFCEHLNTVEAYIATTASQSMQEDRNFIALSLNIFQSYKDIWQNQNRISKSTRNLDLEKLILKFKAAMDHLQNTGNVRILKHMQKLKNIIKNGFFVPPEAIQIRVVSLADSMDNFIKMGVPIHCSLLTEDFKIELKKNNINTKKSGNFPNNVPECDIHLFNLVAKARNLATVKLKHENNLTVPIKRVLAKFSNALESYAAYGQTGVEDFYDRAVVCFSGISFIIDFHCKNFFDLLKIVEKITNVIICFTIPNYREPSKVLVQEILLLLESTVKLLKIVDKGTISTIRSHLYTSNTIPCSITINKPDDGMMGVTKQKIQDYNASMALLGSNDRVKLEFPNILTYLSFAQDNQNLLGRLNLAAKESLQHGSIPQEIIDKIKKQLSSECKNFISSKISIIEGVNNQLKESQTCMNDKTVEKHLEGDLHESIKSIYPNHELLIFGSRATGQALPGSDFDFYCDTTGSKYVTGMDYNDQRSSVKMVGSQLKQNPKIFSHVVLLTNTRVPIVKLVHNPTRMDCDISFKDGTSVENTRLLNVYLQLDPRVRWILTAVKLWAVYNEIHGSRYFTSHCLSWLVLFYLMKEGVVPPVKVLQTPCKPKIINHWNVAFECPKQWVPRTKTSELELLRGFFAWVVNANLDTHCLCTYTGDAIPKKSLAKMQWMKKYEEGLFRKYVERIEEKRLEPKQKKRNKMKQSSKFSFISHDKKIEMNGFSGLCVQDPFEHCKNIAKPVEKVQYENFISLCKQTSCILDSLN